MALKYVQTTLNQRIRAVIILLITGKLYAWNITLSKRITHRQRLGKGILLKIYKQAVANGDRRMIDFCKCIFECYDLHKINGHIKRPNGKHK